MIQHMTKNNLGRERVDSAYTPHHSLSSKEVRVGTQGRRVEAVNEAEARGHGGRLLTGLLSFLSYTTQAHLPRTIPSHINH